MTHNLNKQPQNQRGSQDFNVYFARGHGFDFVAGNILYRKLIRENSNAYKAARKQKEKGHIVNYIVNQVHLRGGRFYSQCKHDHDEVPFVWKESSQEKLKIKVRQSLRDSKGDEALSGEEQEENNDMDVVETNGNVNHINVANEQNEAILFQLDSSCGSVSPIKHHLHTEENNQFCQFNDTDKMTFLNNVIDIDESCKNSSIPYHRHYHEESNDAVAKVSPRYRQESFASPSYPQQQLIQGEGSHNNYYHHYIQSHDNSYQYVHQREGPGIGMPNQLESSSQFPQYNHTINDHHHNTYSSNSIENENISSHSYSRHDHASCYDWSMNQDENARKMMHYSPNHNDWHRGEGANPQVQEAPVKYNYQSTEFQGRKDATSDAFYLNQEEDGCVEPTKLGQHYQCQTKPEAVREEVGEEQIQSILDRVHHDPIFDQLEIRHSHSVPDTNSLYHLHAPSSGTNQSAQELPEDLSKSM